MSPLLYTRITMTTNKEWNYYRTFKFCNLVINTIDCSDENTFSLTQFELYSYIQSYILISYARIVTAFFVFYSYIFCERAQPCYSLCKHANMCQLAPKKDANGTFFFIVYHKEDMSDQISWQTERQPEGGATGRTLHASEKRMFFDP